MTLVLALSVNAQEKWKKSWNFTKWSAETVSNLMAGSDWSDIEKATASEPTEASKDKCFWEVTARGNASENITLTANDVVIKELEGLWYTNTNSRSLAIAVDYPTAKGSYNGPSYLWLGASKKDYFMIPHVAPGTTIKMGVESHDTSTPDARGVELYIGHGHAGTKLLDPDGNAVTMPTYYEDKIWLVPEDATPTNEEDGTVDIQIYNTNGCHIYYITVGEGDTPDVEEAKKVAFVANPAKAEEDMSYLLLNTLDGIETTIVDATAAITLDSLQAYDAVVIASSVAATDAMVPVLKSAVAFQPIVNMNANLYEAWGFGSPVATSEIAAIVAEGKAEHALFTDLDVEAGLSISAEAGLTGVTLGDYFANDDILATVDGKVAIHQHNPARNTYLYLPYSEDVLYGPDMDVLPVLIGNAVTVAANTKTKVSAVAKSTITMENKNLATVVTIANGNKDAKIYYTTDGTEPTEASTLYTEPFTLTEACTVSARAFADGYLASDIATANVEIFSQAATPVISIEKNADNSVVTITCPTEGASIYYSYNKVTEAAKAQKYTEPIVLRDEPTFIYAFAEADGFVASELAEEYVAINSITSQTIRIDTLTHFDANETDWFINDTENGGTGAAKAYYFWGKSSWNYYSEEIDHTETVTGSDGQDSIVYYYKPDPNAVKVVHPLNENGWILKSAGQVLTGELTAGGEAAVGNGATGYFAETAEDMLGGIPTKGKITFGGKKDGEPCTASIETTGKYAAPFDVVVYVTNGGTGNPNLQIQVSADGEKWDSIGTLKMAGTQRYYKKTRVSYETAGEYYVRVAQVNGSTKAQVYDIYILNNGENSQKYDAETVGIENISTAEVAYDEVFSINGVRQNGLRKGLNIVRKHLADGTVKTVKVMVK